MADTTTTVDTTGQTAATSTTDGTQQQTTAQQTAATTTATQTGADGTQQQTTAQQTTTTTTATQTDGQQKPGVWPEDWRETYAAKQGDADGKLLKQLQRYASPEAALDALFNARKKISSGELKSSLKADATPEELKAWREENGIPDSAEKYDTTLKDGLIFSEADKPVVDAFLKRAHDANMHPDQVKTALQFYAEQQDVIAQEMAANDIGAKEACEEALRAEYGPQYKRNMQAANELLAGAPGGVHEALLGARAADGTPLASDPAVLRWLVGLAHEMNPIGTLVPGSGTNAMQAAEGELAALRGKMADKNSDYWKGANAQKNQQRYRELISAVQKVGAR